jgi:pilus assembly protein CpaB
MTLRIVLLLVSALGAAGMTAVFAKSWLSAERAANKQAVVVENKEAKTMVLVAGETLNAGSFVQDKHLKWQVWPKDGVTENFFVKPKKLAEGKNGKESFIGAVARTTINVGEPVTNKRIVHPGERGFLAAVLTPGQRAVSVPVNTTTGISGFVFPGDKVDLLLTVKFKGKNRAGKETTRYFSETLMRNIRVLAIDQTIENADGKVKPIKTVTVEVSPKQAEGVAIALNMGSISLSLHSLAKDEMELKLADLRNQEKSFTLDRDVYFMNQGAKKRVAPRTHKIDILRGEKAEKAKF